jgi:predicted  nucleic acid-binding Zn-ribbon protein
MKLKNLEKKVRRLEARLRAGPKKLAKLKRKLDAMTAAKARKAQKKAAARAVARQTAKPVAAKAKPAAAKSPSAAKTVKRKLNISPERRAQLSAAMKARWAAKRAAVEANSQSASLNQGSAQG